MSLDQLRFRSIPVTIFVMCFVLIYVWVYWSFPGPWGSPTSKGLDASGALNSARVDSGEWWRLFTAPLLHANVFHLLINVANLYVLSVLMIYFYGWLQTLSVFFCSAFGGAVLSWAVGTQRSVGASGALFGLLGVLVVLGWKQRRRLSDEDGHFLRKTLAFWGVLSLASGYVIPMIDNSAHLGGLMVGLSLGMILDVLPNWREE